MQTLAEIRSLLEERGLSPKRSLGQNFLIDHNLIRKLVDASGAHAGDLVLEVGPGTGTMTEELLGRGCRVVACELDDGLADLLRERLGGNPLFTLVHRDCLEGKHELAAELVGALRRGGGESENSPSRFILVSNLPYGAATPLISTLLMEHAECRVLAVTVQREAADRLLAKPGSKDFGPISVLVEVFTEAERIARLPPECFWPRPEVNSSMVVMRRRGDPITRDARGLSGLLRDLFAHRRKQIGGVLGAGVDWGRVAEGEGCSGVRPTLRAEELSAGQIVALGRVLGRVQG